MRPFGTHPSHPNHLPLRHQHYPCDLYRPHLAYRGQLHHHQEVVHQEVDHQEVVNQEVDHQEVGHQEVDHQEVGHQEEDVLYEEEVVQERQSEEILIKQCFYL